MFSIFSIYFPARLEKSNISAKIIHVFGIKKYFAKKISV
jgi:hypothetical protein